MTRSPYTHKRRMDVSLFPLSIVRFLPHSTPPPLWLTDCGWLVFSHQTASTLWWKVGSFFLMLPTTHHITVPLHILHTRYMETCNRIVYYLCRYTAITTGKTLLTHSTIQFLFCHEARRLPDYFTTVLVFSYTLLMITTARSYSYYTRSSDYLPVVLFLHL